MPPPPDPAQPAAPEAVDAPPETPEPSGALRFFLLFKDLLKPRNLLLVAGALLVGLVAATGGFSQIEGVAQQVPTARPSATVTAAPLEVVVHSAFWSSGADDPIGAQPAGLRRLVVLVEVTDTAGRPVDALTLADSFRIDAPGLRFYGRPQDPATTPPKLIRAADLLDGRAAQPGLKTPLALSWDQDVTAQYPSQVTLTVRGHVWRVSSLDGAESWFDATDAVRVTVLMPKWER